MKLFKKKEKSKKPLTDKAKQERKDKTKRIIKRVLDVLVYGFAIFMIFGLLLGSCNTKAKPGSAYYHTDNGYTSLNSVVVNNTSTSLRFYYDYNYKKTFPSWSTLFSILPTANTIGKVRLDNSIYIEESEFVYVEAFHHPEGYFILSLRTDDNVYPQANVSFIEVYTDNIIVTRSDLLTTLFSGSYRVYAVGTRPNDVNFYRWLTYYFGELGYNRITYSFPINVSRLAYLFVNSDNTDNLLENGYFFKNDELPHVVDNEGVSVYETLFRGSFRCNGVYYTGIEVRFTSVFGNMIYGDTSYGVKYYMPGFTGVDDYIASWNEFYNGYWYIDKLYFVNADIRQEVWSAFKTQMTPGATASYNYYDLQFVDTWVGDTAYNSSPYRDLYIYYCESALSGVIAYPFNENYPQLNGMSFADFINFIGEAYPSGNYGVPQDNTSPFTSVFSWLRIALSGAMPFFGYTLIPGITIGTLVMVPITMSIILFVVKLFKR